MKSPGPQLQQHVRNLIALALLCAAFLMARLPQISASERKTLAQRFRFEALALPVTPGPERRSVRPVHPSLQHLAGWISSVGAAVALNDLDGDGLSNDFCYVDVRTDQVIVAPVPGMSQRYRPFALDAGRLYQRDTMAPMGCLPGDMNEDGRIDLLVYYWGRTPLAFLRTGESMANTSYRPFAIIPGEERWYTNAAAFADLDGDGHADLIAGNYFEDGSRILEAGGSGLEHMQHSMSRAFNGGGKRLLLWDQASSGSVRYREIRGVLDERRGWTLALGVADLDGDLLPEIYFANDFGPDQLLHNRSTPGHLNFQPLHGVRSFWVPKSKVLGSDSFKGMGVDLGDVNGDGWPDLFVSNIAAPYSLEESHFLWVSTGQVDRMKQGVAPYHDLGESMGVSRSSWGWDTRLADFDNDGVPEAIQAVGFLRGSVTRWPELHEAAMGNDQLLKRASTWHRFGPGDDVSGDSLNPFYVRAFDGRYYDVSAEMRMDPSHVSRGIAIADADGDGLLDYAVANQWEDSWFLHNRGTRPAAFLGLRIQWVNGTPLIGATAVVELPDGRRMSAQVDGGSGHSGKRSPEVHFGLAGVAPGQSLSVEISWRDRAGVAKERLRLTTGWHTVRLGRRS